LQADDDVIIPEEPYSESQSWKAPSKTAEDVAALQKQVQFGFRCEPYIWGDISFEVKMLIQSRASVKGVSSAQGLLLLQQLGEAYVQSAWQRRQDGSGDASHDYWLLGNTLWVLGAVGERADMQLSAQQQQEMRECVAASVQLRAQATALAQISNVVQGMVGIVAQGSSQQQQQELLMWQLQQLLERAQQLLRETKTAAAKQLADELQSLAYMMEAVAAMKLQARSKVVQPSGVTVQQWHNEQLISTTEQLADAFAYRLGRVASTTANPKVAQATVQVLAACATLMVLPLNTWRSGDDGRPVTERLQVRF
jgi:hypothetical protein